MYYNATPTNITLFGDDGQQRVISQGHPYFNEIQAALHDPSSTLPGWTEELLHLAFFSSDHQHVKEIDRVLADPSWGDFETEILRLARASKTPSDMPVVRLSERVTLQDGTLFFDGDEVDSLLGDHILDLLAVDEAEIATGLIAFMEKLATNPNAETREALYEWVWDKNLVILPDGNFLAYKGVKVSRRGRYYSIRSGFAFVDDVPVDGRVPQKPGTTITFPRNSVNADASVVTGLGLHVGTLAYAEGWNRGAILEVSVNPRNVVVALDNKLRVSAYDVLDNVNRPDETRLEYIADYTAAFEVASSSVADTIKAINDALDAITSVCDCDCDGEDWDDTYDSDNCDCDPEECDKQVDKQVDFKTTQTLGFAEYLKGYLDDVFTSRSVAESRAAHPAGKGRPPVVIPEGDDFFSGNFEEGLLASLVASEALEDEEVNVLPEGDEFFSGNFEDALQASLLSHPENEVVEEPVEDERAEAPQGFRNDYAHPLDAFFNGNFEESINSLKSSLNKTFDQFKEEIREDQEVKNKTADWFEKLNRIFRDE